MSWCSKCNNKRGKGLYCSGCLKYNNKKKPLTEYGEIFKQVKDGIKSGEIETTNKDKD